MNSGIDVPNARVAPIGGLNYQHDVAILTGGGDRHLTHLDSQQR